MMATILMPLPACDFDPTEVAIPWRVLSRLGHRIVFATPDGETGEADKIMLDGGGLDPWGKVPVLRRLPLLGLLLRANADARSAYRELEAKDAFRHPVRWDGIDANEYEALVLPGGHRARGMREYLESPVLHGLVASFFSAGKPVGAICHGVLLAARSRDSNGASVLYGRKVTSLTWAQERAADSLARVGRWWDPSYYRTYQEEADQPAGYMSVEQEVTRALGTDGSFVDVPKTSPHASRKTLGLHRDSEQDRRPSWVVVDGNLVTARWPGDAHAFAHAFGRQLSA